MPLSPLTRWFALLLTLALPGRAAEQSYILFLTADGFRTDYIEWYEPPHLKQLIAEGVRVTDARNVFPTLTTPNMTSLLTGAWPRTTGIAVNTQYLKETDKIEKSPRGNTAETIAETLKKAGWKTGGVNHFMLQNRGADFYSTVGYDNAEKTTDAIIDLLKNKQVRFVGVIYGATDKAGHQHGPRSEQVKAAVLDIDRAIGRLVASLKEQGIYEETLITFNSDHGMSPFDKKQASISPTRALTEAGFKVASNETELNADTQIIVIDAGGRAVYFRQITDGEKAKAIRILAAIAGVEKIGRAHV